MTCYKDLLIRYIPYGEGLPIYCFCHGCLRRGGGLPCALALLRYAIPTLIPCCCSNRLQLYHNKLATARCVPLNFFSLHLFGVEGCGGYYYLQYFTAGYTGAWAISLPQGWGCVHSPGVCACVGPSIGLSHLALCTSRFIADGCKCFLSPTFPIS
jgi:hypothetical protein